MANETNQLSQHPWRFPWKFRPQDRQPHQASDHAGARRADLGDSIKALVLLGIVAATFYVQSGLELLTPERLFELNGRADWLATFVFEALVFDPAVSAFAVVFGFGFGTLLRKKTEGGEGFGTYVRYALVLGIFGLVHSAFFFWGDLLLPISIFAVALLLLKFLPRPLLLALSLILVFVVPFLLASLTLFYGMPSRFDLLTATGIEDGAILARLARGSILTVIDQNLELAVSSYQGFTPERIWSIFNAFGVFLFGAWLGRTSLAERPFSSIRLLRRRLLSHRRERSLKLLIGVGIFSGLAACSLAAVVSILGSHALFRAVILSLKAGVPLLTATYFVSALIWLSSKKSERVRRSLAPMGRMFLTLYFAQALLGHLIFYGYGFELAGSQGAAATLGLALLAFIVLFMASHLWQLRRAYGPLDALVLALAYRRTAPLAESPKSLDRVYEPQGRRVSIISNTGHEIHLRD